MAPKKTIAESYQLFFQNMFNFNGRTRRSDYWRVVIINSLIVGAIGGAIGGIFGQESAVGSVLSSLLSIAVFVIELALVVRRLHDTGKEWTYILFSLIPLVGWIIVFIALLKDSDPGDNQFGPNPKAVPADGGFAPQGFDNAQAPYGGAPVPPANYNPEPVAPPAAPAFGTPAAPAEPIVQEPAAPAAPEFEAPVAPAAPAVEEPVAPAAPAFEAPVAPAAAFCTSCGAQLPEGANVCPSCGTPKE